MAYYNHTSEQSSNDPALSQYQATQMMTIQPHMVGQPHVVGQPHMVGQPYVAGQPYVYPMQLAMGKYAAGYSRITSVCLGVLQIGLSWLSIAAASLAIVFDASGWELGTGFWCAAIYLTAGSVHIAAGVSPTNELITAATVFSTLVFPVGAAQLALSVYALVDSIVCGSVCITDDAFSLAAHISMGNIGIFEMIFGLCLFIVGIRSMCCPPRTQQQFILIANDGTTGLVPTTTSIASTDTMAVTSNSATQNDYTTERNSYDEMQQHQQQAEASAPDYCAPDYSPVNKKRALH